MTRERFEQILFAHVSDEVVQDMLNQYVIELESSNAKLRELVAKMARALGVNSEWCDRDCEREFDCNWMDECPIASAMKELGAEVTDG